MFTASLYAEKIKLAADVKRKENNGLMTGSYISILERYFVCIWCVSNDFKMVYEIWRT